MVDQSPIGRTTRSNPASYVGAWDAIRKLFARTRSRRARLHAGTFSFNAGNGRCPACSGNGFEHVEMQFLSDVYLRCPDCDGKRFRPEVLEVKMRPRGGPATIADVLEMTVARRPRSSPRTAKCRAHLAPLVDVGLDYLRLGQPVPTLSGGEAQRLKLAGHLRRGRSRGARRRRARCSCSTSRPRGCTSTTLRGCWAPSTPARRGPFADRDRAQPRRDPRGRLAHRPRPRGRRARRRARVRGTPGRDARRRARIPAARSRLAAARDASSPTAGESRQPDAGSRSAARRGAARYAIAAPRARAQPEETSTSRSRATASP